MSDLDLKGRGILVTRAAHQADGLVERIQTGQGRAIRFPALEILACEQPGPVRDLLQRSWDVIIFVSPNAVFHALKLLAGNRLQATLGAVGEATAAALRQSGYSIDLLPADRYDSEGLLMLAPLQEMTGQKVLIVRGEGGRALLGEGLQARGAEVGYAEVYRRVRPAVDPYPLLAQWQEQVDLVTVTSIEVMENLIALVGDSGWPLLQHTPLLVISERMLRHAESRGFQTVLLAAGANDDAIMSAIQNWVECTS
ncbi:MAG: uroporphyrinogen III synthase [gamma proteobacterium symbiont of Ctena orbiculata]|nr:MAG: uroporphyrinogen III synthase [gamma proteobacterium symbiont of Ctena orbiculata]PUB87538.1 MAG: uroporphyrinogen III synthase [gamma proteobacterium symbiont of Ctena orbiculata]